MAKIKIRLRAEIVKDETGKTRLKFENPNYYRQQVEQFKNDKHVIVTMENQKSQRTLKQNSYWHKVCFPIISELTGYTEIEAKAVCTALYIEPKIVEVNGKEVEIRKGTSELSISEGVTFTMNMIELAKSLGGKILSSCEAGYFCGRLDCEICNKKIKEL